MSWITILENPEGVTSLFDVQPDLDRVELSSVSLDREAAVVTIKILVNATPQRVPSRWRNIVVTRVAICLQVIDAKEFNLSGWGTEIVGNLRIEKLENRCVLSFESGISSFRVSGMFLRLNGLEPVA